jgi:hypothetical protein
MKRLSLFLAFVVVLVGLGVAFQFLVSNGVAFQISPGSSILYLPAGTNPLGNNCSSAYLPFNWVIPSGPLYYCNGSPGTWQTTGGPPSAATGTPGVIAVLINPTAAITSTETTILAAPIPAGVTKAGSMFRATAYCLATVTSTGAGTSIMRLRWGPTGTPSDALVLHGISSVATATNVSNIGFSTEQLVTFSAANATNISGGYTNSTNATGAWPSVGNKGYFTSSGALPVAAEYLQLTWVNTGGFVSVVCNNAMIELLKL